MKLLHLYFFFIELFNMQTNNSPQIIMNSDGIYLASYYALLFNFKLHQNGYFKGTNNGRIPINEV